jgi:hypothetical protein
VSNIFYNEGEQHLLASYFQDEPVTFGPFYVGLGTGGATINEHTTLADLVEISDIGYSRQIVNRDAGPNGWELRNGYVQSPVVEFTNPGPTACWDSIDFAFVTLSPEGLTGNTTLIAATDFPNSVYLTPGKTQKVIFRCNVRSGLLVIETVSNFSISMVSNAILVADGTVI